MNARLTQLCTEKGYSEEKVTGLIDLFEGDETFVEQLLQKRHKSHDDAHMLKATYKDVIEFDETALTLSRADIDAIAQAVTAALRQGAPAQAKPKLSDQGAMVLPSTKAYNASSDLFAIAVGADQVGRAAPATKSRPVTLEALVKGYRWDGR